ncbi:hypothetical protein [Bailinhaonella thermotolerans]|uniref:Phage head morphogenesis domain-containing protein n=1 Tax=Bailinhaonella thermotolerans TaxID=1070861 RepID=A0A3A4AKJ9_9ACTN|nr:hypothetical protein [Bailinhaonella thermotolerans]RJL19346.1 hypothetical protein D5H75_40495 [Bailinhaonella thermotolerans]
MADLPEWASRPDPWLTRRMHHAARIARVEAEVTPAVVEAMAEYLRAVRAAVLPEVERAGGGGARVASGGVVPDLAGVWPDGGVWVDLVDALILPRLLAAWGEAFFRTARDAILSVERFREAYMSEIHDRLSPRKWPQVGVFEEVRYELLEAQQNGEDLEQMVARLGEVLDISAPSRALRARAAELRKIRDDPERPAWERARARAELRGIYDQLPDADRMWQPDARRIARTETMGALNGGAYAGAVAWSEASGEPMWRQWLATPEPDTRIRRSHRRADGQIRPELEPFDVGDAQLTFPGTPMGPAHEVINCRCTALYLDEDEAGEQFPEQIERAEQDLKAAREARDDKAVEDALRRLADLEDQYARFQASQAQRRPADAPASEEGGAPEDLTGLTDDDLAALYSRALNGGDDELARRAIEEMERRDAADHAPPADTPAEAPAEPEDGWGAWDAIEETDEDRRISDLIAQGWEYRDAYAEVHGLDPDALDREERRAAVNAQRREGESLDQVARRLYDEWVYVQYLEAEAATRGVLLNRAGVAAGIDPITLFSGPESRAKKYASEELRRWWSDHPRVPYLDFRADLLGRDSDRRAARRRRESSRGLEL